MSSRGGTKSVGRTEAQAKVIGERETREYTFLVDTGATYLALPAEEIEALGLRQSRGRLRLMSATGIVEVNTYFADGELMGQEFGAILVPASIPLIGYELLENLRFRVNPVTREIEKVPEDEAHPPYLL
jgi:predicted aspartyl protease